MAPMSAEVRTDVARGSTAVEEPSYHPAMWKHRDVVIEDEIFHCGYFADIVFLLQRAHSSEFEEVYGQSGAFALHSAPLRRIIADAIPARVRQTAGAVSCREVHVPPELASPAGFREVARYVYGLPAKFSAATLSEVLAAAHWLGLPELEQAAVAWGLRRLDLARCCHKHPFEGAEDNFTVCDAIRCLDQLCLFESSDAQHWRDSMMETHRPAEILADPSLMDLSQQAMCTLFRNEHLRRLPDDAWSTSVQWARLRAGTVIESDEPTLPRRLPARGAKLAVPPPPPQPPSPAVAWQRCLLLLVASIDFAQMSAASFAKYVDAVDPMLPELRQVIYAVRRKGLLHTDSLQAIEGA